MADEPNDDAHVLGDAADRLTQRIEALAQSVSVELGGAANTANGAPFELISYVRPEGPPLEDAAQMAVKAMLERATELQGGRSHLVWQRKPIWLGLTLSAVLAFEGGAA